MAVHLSKNFPFYPDPFPALARFLLLLPSTCLQASFGSRPRPRRRHGWTLFHRWCLGVGLVEVCLDPSQNNNSVGLSKPSLSSLSVALSIFISLVSQIDSNKKTVFCVLWISQPHRETTQGKHTHILPHVVARWVCRMASSLLRGASILCSSLSLRFSPFFFASDLFYDRLCLLTYCIECMPQM